MQGILKGTTGLDVKDLWGIPCLFDCNKGGTRRHKKVQIKRNEGGVFIWRKKTKVSGNVCAGRQSFSRVGGGPREQILGGAMKEKGKFPY